MSNNFEAWQCRAGVRLSIGPRQLSKRRVVYREKPSPTSRVESERCRPRTLKPSLPPSTAQGSISTSLVAYAAALNPEQFSWKTSMQRTDPTCRQHEGHMVRIVEHRSALPNGPILAVHVRHDANAEPAVSAHIAVEVFGQTAHPDALPRHMPVEEAFLQALAYAERAGLTVVWIDDPGGFFPPDKRPVRDVGK